MKNKNTIFVIASFSDSLINFRKHLLQEFINNGHSVISCAPGNGKNVISELSKMGVKYIKISLNATGTNPFKDIKTIFELRNIFKKYQPKYVISYTIKPVIYGSMAASFAKINNQYSMITGLGYSFNNNASYKKILSNFLIKWLFKYGIRNNKVIFFQNPDDLRDLSAKGIINKKSKTLIINGSGIDLDHFKYEPINNSKKSFLLIARLIKDKGIIEYVEAACIIKKKYPSAIFNIIGFYYDNPTAIKPEEMNQWQKDGIINYLGSTNDVRPYIKDANVYVLPSFYREGTPRSILEAMSMGRPIITTDAPGCRETVINGDNGFLVPVKDAKALADAMEKFIKNPELIPVMGKRSREIAEEKYDVHKVNQKICEAMGIID